MVGVRGMKSTVSAGGALDNVAEDMERDGFAVVPSFLPETMTESLVSEFQALVDAFEPSEHPLTVFETGAQDQGKEEYFLESGDKIRYFFEDSVSEAERAASPRDAINKLGHALHELNPVFADFSWDDRIRQVLTAANVPASQDPVLVQSMYIVKPPRVGGEVSPHQDGSFLIDTPASCVGLWFALEDATIDNGCLWALPGSHRDPLYARFARDEPGGSSASMSGSFPEFDPETYVPLEVKAGSVVVLHGSVLHASKANTSERSRHAYTLHFKHRESEWDPCNWLQSGIGFHGWETPPRSLPTVAVTAPALP